MSRRRTVQTRLVDFDEDSDEDPIPKRLSMEPELPIGQIWRKITDEGEEWAVCNFDGTVFFARLVEGKIHAYGTEATCKWCESTLVIRNDKVFCGGHCGRYQGEFSRDLSAYLHWDGAKSYTLRKQVAKIEGIELESRDLEPFSFAPTTSILEEFEDNE